MSGLSWVAAVAKQRLNHAHTVLCTARAATLATPLLPPSSHADHGHILLQPSTQLSDGGAEEVAAAAAAALAAVAGVIPAGAINDLAAADALLAQQSDGPSTSCSGAWAAEPSSGINVDRAAAAASSTLVASSSEDQSGEAGLDANALAAGASISGFDNDAVSSGITAGMTAATGRHAMHVVTPAAVAAAAAAAAPPTATVAATPAAVAALGASADSDVFAAGKGTFREEAEQQTMRMGDAAQPAAGHASLPGSAPPLQAPVPTDEKPAAVVCTTAPQHHPHHGSAHLPTVHEAEDAEVLPGEEEEHEAAEGDEADGSVAGISWPIVWPQPGAPHLFQQQQTM